MAFLRTLRGNAYVAAVSVTAVCGGAFEEGGYRRGESLCSNRNTEESGRDGGLRFGGGGDDGGSSSKNRREDTTTPVLLSPRIGMGDSLNYGWKNGDRDDKRRYKYSVIGGGTTAAAAMESILHQDPNADILFVSDEATLPHADVQKGRVLKPDLMASYNEWRRHVSTKLDASFRKLPSITVLLDGNHLQIDPERRALVFFDGREFFFSKCLLAMPGTPRRFYVLDSDRSSLVARNRVNALSNLSDFELIEAVPDMMPEGGGRALVVGGGFLGTEVALALANRNIKVSQAYAEVAPLASYLPPYLALYVQSLLKKSGVDPVGERLVTGIRATSESESDASLEASLVGVDKQHMMVEYVVLASTHVDPGPMLNLANKSGFEVDSTGGIVVNGFMEAAGGVYAAGSCVSYYDQALGRRRVDTLDHSINSGLIAGYNMVMSEKQLEEKGSGKHFIGGAGIEDDNRRTQMPSMMLPSSRNGDHQCLYTHQPLFRSTLESVGVVMEGIGNVDSRLKTFGVWVDNKPSIHTYPHMGKRKQPAGGGKGEECCKPMSRGIVYYLNDGKIEGILLWNASDLLDRARDIIRLQPTVSGLDSLKSLVSLAPNEWLHVIETS